MSPARDRPEAAFARRRALQAARAILERYALGRPYDHAVSRILDALYVAEEDTMTPELDAALKPSAFDYCSCIACHQPVYGGPTLSWLLRPPGPNEPDPPVRVIFHERCEAKFYAAAFGFEEDSEAAA